MAETKIRQQLWNTNEKKKLKLIITKFTNSLDRKLVWTTNKRRNLQLNMTQIIKLWVDTVPLYKMSYQRLHSWSARAQLGELWPPLVQSSPLPPCPLPVHTAHPLPHVGCSPPGSTATARAYIKSQISTSSIHLALCVDVGIKCAKLVTSFCLDTLNYQEYQTQWMFSMVV